jgi:uncharacterized protein (DUF885 family)
MTVAGVDSAAVIDRFFDRLMEIRPVEATYHGLHQHDSRFPDGSLTGVREQQELVQRFESELAACENDLDVYAARYYAALTRFQLEELGLWARMPEAIEQIGTGVLLLFGRDFAPLEHRLELLAARLEQVPGYLEASREQLLEPIGLWCEVGLVTARQLPELFAAVVGAAAPGPLRARLEAAAGSASQATEDYARWLEGDVLPRASNDFALGEERFARLVELRAFPDSADAILAIGWQHLESVKEERRQLVEANWPGRHPPEVAELLRGQQPLSFEAVLDEYRSAIAAARQYVGGHGLATLPINEELQVRATPAFLRPVIPSSAYEAPARFDHRQVGVYIVTPRQGNPGDQSIAAIVNTAIHEGYPGHHLRFACANQHPSVARLLAGECAHELVEGWPHYAEQLMYEHGFAASPEVRFVQLTELVWRACSAVIDVELSSGRMTLGQAVDLLMEEAAVDRPAAEAAVRRYTFTPGQHLSDLYGRHLLLELRQRRRRAEGSAFDLRAFHDRLLYAGALPASAWDVLLDS